MSIGNPSIYSLSGTYIPGSLTTLKRHFFWNSVLGYFETVFISSSFLRFGSFCCFVAVTYWREKTCPTFPMTIILLTEWHYFKMLHRKCFIKVPWDQSKVTSLENDFFGFWCDLNLRTGSHPMSQNSSLFKGNSFNSQSLILIFDWEIYTVIWQSAQRIS